MCACVRGRGRGPQSGPWEGRSSRDRGARQFSEARTGLSGRGSDCALSHPGGSRRPLPPPRSLGTPTHCPWPSRGPATLRVVGGVLPGAAPDGAPTVSRGLDSVEASPRPLPGRVLGNEDSGETHAPEGRGAGGGGELAGSSSGRVGLRPGHPHAHLHIPRPSARPPEAPLHRPAPPHPFRLAPPMTRLGWDETGRTHKAPEEAQRLWPDGHSFCPIKTSRPRARLSVPPPRAPRGAIGPGGLRESWTRPRGERELSLPGRASRPVCTG